MSSSSMFSPLPMTEYYQAWTKKEQEWGARKDKRNIERGQDNWGFEKDNDDQEVSGKTKK